ncbi:MULTISPECIES: nitrate reductase molybdenum cofactor assembly chaperone [unclassified Nocardiopsis]|jgi:nitrate reductase molybdenum cofactor assembly chaperone NarJ/NarW|uniref:nitrate reductase molybdenum cofactor assembly chaperone n=1 Tax=unclassified Nocardiopsis TaxID=2649073 RepID=UPI000AABADE3|nr:MULTISPECIES: nitrate reductase molybdenum cofactor assembly chaperone [unclassified Nocardiopsis]
MSTNTNTNGTEDVSGDGRSVNALGTRPVIPSQDGRDPDGPGRTGWLGAGRAARRAHSRAVTHQAASVLLGYPDALFFERLPLAARAAAELPKSQSRTLLLEFCEHASSTPELELAEHYVDVFDLKRRRALHMTYYTDGDTRRRGHALAEIKRVYTEAGWRVEARELPDHLAVMLEFAARGDADAGQELLVDFRSGLDLLSRSLEEHGTPYARVVDAVRYTLPPPRRADEERVRRLAQEGPPAEDVGMEPYGARPRVPLPLTDVTRKPQ